MSGTRLKNFQSWARSRNGLVSKGSYLLLPTYSGFSAQMGRVFRMWIWRTRITKDNGDRRMRGVTLEEALTGDCCENHASRCPWDDVLSRNPILQLRDDQGVGFKPFDMFLNIANSNG